MLSRLYDIQPEHRILDQDMQREGLEVYAYIVGESAQ